MKKRGSVIRLAAILGLLSGLILSAPVAARDSDVLSQLQQEYARAGWADVRIAVDHGVVTLTGEVPHVWAKQRIERDAQRVSGVDRVVNGVSIARVSDDITLKKTLADQVQRWVLGTVFDDVSVSVLNGNAVLTGYLTTPYKLSPLVDLIARTPGVQSVTPDSAVDEHLRMTVASALYRDAAFGDAAIDAVKPIRIIVRNARVTLRGSVRNNQVRAKAEDIVRSVAGVLSVDNGLAISTSTN